VQEQLDETFIAMSGPADQAVLAATHSFDLKFLARPDSILFAEFGGKNDLSF
jgi:hypothetical protein